MVVAVAAERPEAGAQWYSVPAMTRLDVGLFGEAAVMLRHNGEPVPLDGSGVTVEPLQHGALYYVLVSKRGIRSGIRCIVFIEICFQYLHVDRILIFFGKECFIT
jgi:hypothetical protein